jgi:hypothetical protein
MRKQRKGKKGKKGKWERKRGKRKRKSKNHGCQCSEVRDWLSFHSRYQMHDPERQVPG